MTSRARAACTAAVIAALTGAALTGASITGASPAVRTAAAPTDGLSYVALGDSFAAGLGLPAKTGGPVVGCGQSAMDYPHRVATALAAKLTDVTCAGAETVNVISTPQKTSSGTAPVQLDSLGVSTRIVTITIGGNDLGFFTTTASCVALSANGPLLAREEDNCRQMYVKNGVDTLAARIAGPVLSGVAAMATPPPAARGLTETFAAITRAAPNAQVFVVGYPTIMPGKADTPAAGCFRGQIEGTSLDTLRIDNGFPFTNVDVEYLRSIEKALDVATKVAAEQAGFTYISMLSGSAAHSGCAAPLQSYVNGISLKATKKFSVALSDGALHPNARGAAFMADRVVAEVKQAFVATGTPDSPGNTPGNTAGIPPGILAGAAVLLAALLAVAIVLLRRARRNRNRPRPEQ